MCSPPERMATFGYPEEDDLGKFINHGYSQRPSYHAITATWLRLWASLKSCVCPQSRDIRTRQAASVCPAARTH